jgi:hypothetical protein
MAYTLLLLAVLNVNNYSMEGVTCSVNEILPYEEMWLACSSVHVRFQY